MTSPHGRDRTRADHPAVEFFTQVSITDFCSGQGGPRFADAVLRLSSRWGPDLLDSAIALITGSAAGSAQAIRCRVAQPVRAVLKPSGIWPGHDVVYVFRAAFLQTVVLRDWLQSTGYQREAAGS